ncbi:WD40 repeat-like protein [Suillus weaverae]|nr:WD40 repeat-like protein [Suillus weaverae]
MAAATHDASSQVPTRKEPPHVKMILKGHKNRVVSIAFIPGTRLLVTGSNDKSLRVWDLDTGKPVGEPLLSHDAAVWVVTASLNGRWIVSGGGGDGSILVWEVATNKREFKNVPVSFKGHSNVVWDVVFASDSETFASASEDETVCIWKRETGKIVLGPFKLGSRAHSVSYSPDNSKLAAGTHKYIIVWDTKTGEELLKIDQRAYKVAFTPDARRLVSGNLQDIRISDATTGDIIKQFDAHTESFYSLAIAPNGAKFATTSHDKTTRFFDLINFEPIGEPLEHPDIVWCVAFSKDGQHIATGCDDSLVRTWTVPLSESEKESQQSAQKILKVYFHCRLFVRSITQVLQKTIPGSQPHPRRAPIPTSRFFDDFDPRSPPGRSNRAATTTRHTEGSGIKNMMNHLFSRSSASQGHTPRPRKTPPVDVFPTRGKYRTANAHTGKRHKLAQPPRPPRKQAHTSHAGASNSSAPPLAGTSNVVGGTATATLQTGSTRSSSPLDVGHAPHTSCFTVLARFALGFSSLQNIFAGADITGCIGLILVQIDDVPGRQPLSFAAFSPSAE